MQLHLPSRPKYPLVLAAGLLLGAMHGVAAGTETPYLAEMPVVLSASRMPQPLNEAPGSVTVIDGDFIRATGYRDLARIFRFVPGMQIGQERGNSYWVTYHGLGSTFPSELQVLIDGRSIYSPSSFGGVDWAALPLNVDEIDRIEVVRGPNAVSYGANAFMGVINIITRHTLAAPFNLVRGSLGEANIHDADVIANAKHDQGSLRISASSRNDAGFANLNDSRHADILAMRLDWRLSNADEITLRLNQTSTRKGEGYQESFFNSNGERKSSDRTETVHLTWMHAAEAGKESLFHYYHDQERTADTWMTIIPSSYPYGPTQIGVDRNRQSSRDHVEFQHRVTRSQRQTVWGAEARRDTIHAPFLFSQGDPAPVNMYRAFANLDEHLSRTWQLNLGASFERYRDDPLHFAPRAFFNMQLDSAQTLRAGASRAWQQRPTFEKYVSVRAVDPISGVLLVNAFQPNPDLKQSRIDSAEISYLGRFKPLRSSLDVRLFNERVKDYVVRVAVPATAALTPYIGSSQYMNLQHPITLRGIEYQFKAQIARGSEIVFNHALIDRRTGDADVDHRIAPYTASLAWLQEWGSHWASTLSAVRMGPLSGGDGFVPVSSYVAKAYTSFDARLAWHTPLGSGRKLEISLNALNLGERHQEIPDRAEQRYLASRGDDTPDNYASRMLYLTVSLEF